MKLADLKAMGAYAGDDIATKTLTYNGYEFEVAIKSLSYGQVVKLQRNPEEFNQRLLAECLVFEDGQLTYEQVLDLDSGLADMLFMSVIETLNAKKKKTTTGTSGMTLSEPVSVARPSKRRKAA